MSKFTLSITLGNDAMRTPADIATALHRVARILETSDGETRGTIRDANGNTVGSWKGAPIGTVDEDGGRS